MTSRGQRWAKAKGPAAPTNPNGAPAESMLFQIKHKHFTPHNGVLHRRRRVSSLDWRRRYTQSVVTFPLLPEGNLSRVLKN